MAEILGTSGDDTLPGPGDPDTSGDDTIGGLAGNDTISGGTGNDILYGGDDDDLLYGGEGNDSLYGDLGTNLLMGQAGNDFLQVIGNDSANGGDGNDTLVVMDVFGTVFDGGAGTDTLSLNFGTAGSAATVNLTYLFAGLSGSINTATVESFETITGTIVGSGFADSITIGPNYTGALTMALGAGNDSVVGGSGNDTIDGGAGDDNVFGGNGNDVLSDYSGASYLYGDGGDDTITLGSATAGAIDGGVGGTDRLAFDLAAAAAGVSISLNVVGGSISGSLGNVSVAGIEAMALVFHQTTEHNDTITLGAAFDRAITINLLGGNDTYSGGLGGDYVNGGAGNDTLGGGGGTNTLFGGIGNDNFVVENNTTTLVEASGEGTDTVLASLSFSLSNVANIENLTLTGNGNIDGYGDGAANVITGNSGNNRVEAGGGNDTIHGGGGHDTLYGMEGNDTINGDGGDDIIEDGVGTNTFNGGAGGDHIFFSGDAVNTADGGSGTDLLYISNFNRTTGFVIDLTGMWTGGIGSVNGGTVTGFEVLIGFDGTQWADVINFGAGTTAVAGINDAGAGNDILTGTDGANYINGGEGNDTIVSGAGTDEILGGAGNDTITIGAGTSGTVSGGTGTDTLGVGPAQEGAFNIDLTLLWGGGAGTVNGVTVTGIELLQTNFIQSDHFVFGVADSVVIGAGYTGNLTMRLGRGADSASGGSGQDIIDGEQDDDVIRGGAGNDSLGGSYGSDYVYGDAGDDNVSGDTLDVEYAWGNDHLFGGDGNDTIEGGAYQDWLYGEAGNDVLRGDSLALGLGDHGNDLLNGGAGNDQLFGHGGTDTLIGGTGIDSMTGGAGDDQYYVDNAADVVIEGASEGANDRIFASVSYAMSAGVFVERLTTDNNASTAAINLTGNASANLIYGNAGANALDGKDGNDTLSGLGGNDTLIGGLGNDSLAGGAGDDWYYVDSASDIVIEVAGEGTSDRILASVSYTLGAGVDVERLTTDSNAGTAPINLTGSGVANLIYGNAGANILDGRGGADTLIGLGGNDFYYVDNALDSVTEGAGEGTGDRIFASVNYTQGAGVQVELLTTNSNAATSAINLTGNELANYIAGNAGANVLDGKGGTDILTGLGGADSFAFTTALGVGNVDTIADFSVADDTVRLENAVFGGLAAGALAAGAFNTGAAASQADDRIVYNSVTGALLFDIDGVGGVAAVQFATLSTGLAMTAADFLVI